MEFFYFYGVAILYDCGLRFPTVLDCQLAFLMGLGID